MISALFKIFIFPGFLFLFILSFVVEYADRKVYARMQNRMGPPWFQPVLDIIKLLSKETIIPEGADKIIFKALPLVTCAAAVSAFLITPTCSKMPVLGFRGDIVALIYIMTIPTVTYFLAGWYSRSLYSLIGSTRVISQFFLYEVPLLMAVLAPGILASSWTFSTVIDYYSSHGLLFLVNILAFVVALIAVQGKLERLPFDMPEAETEIVAGSFTEYAGPLYAYFRIAMNMQTVAAAALLAAVFIPFGYGCGIFWGTLIFFVKISFIMFLLSIIKTIFARLRMEQMASFCWKILAPLALLQLAVNIIIKALIQ